MKRQNGLVTKAVNRGVAEIVFLAADCQPISIVLHLTYLSETKNVIYVWVPSKVALGRAVGVSRSVIAACITSNEASDLAPQINKMREKIEKLAI
jgi:U4/U6 small nuclear ribonucleoprotein SNU13